MPHEKIHATGGRAPASVALARGAMFFGLWLVLMPSMKPADLAVGALAAVGATWTSLRFLAPAAGRVRFGALLTFMPHFLWQSVLAGVDVARRAFDPRLPLRPGLVVCPVGFPPGLARNEFTTVTSLLPGSVPVGEADGALVYHALDVDQPVAEQIAAEERALVKAFVAGQAHV